MMRRSHKKSRRGCLECKRRHIKCDETRPCCLNCGVAERSCAYPADGAASTSAATSAANSPFVTSDSAPSPAPSNAALVGHIFEQPASKGSRPRPTIFTGKRSDSDPNLNMAHLELYHHFIIGGPFSSPVSPELAAITKYQVIEYSIKAPYVMHQLLAISARHMSNIQSSAERKAFYLDQALQFQTQAITAFKALRLHKSFPDALDHRIPTLGFSTMLATHALCDALSSLDELIPPRDYGQCLRKDALLAFLVRWLDYVRLHRYVNSCVLASLDLYSLADLRPLTPLGCGISQRQPVGRETDALRATICGAEGLSSSAMEACLKAVDGIQIAIDAGSKHDTTATPTPPLPPDNNSRNRNNHNNNNNNNNTTLNPGSLLFWWPLYVPDEFIEALSSGHPDLMAILAYYAVILHRDRSFWAVGNAGARLLHIVTVSLGAGFTDLMEFPRKEVGLGRPEAVYDAVRGWTQRSGPLTTQAVPVMESRTV